MITETYTLPAFWATALINDDTSHFEYEDEKPFQEFCAYMLKEHGNNWPFDCSEETQFMTYHDARRFGVLACDVKLFLFDVTPRPENKGVRGMTQ